MTLDSSLEMKTNVQTERIERLLEIMRHMIAMPYCAVSLVFTNMVSLLVSHKISLSVFHPHSHSYTKILQFLYPIPNKFSFTKKR